MVSLAASLAGCDSGLDGFSAVVEARRVVVSAEAAGRVVDVAVTEGGRVEAGQLVARLDCVGPVAQLEAARAQREQAQAAADAATAQLALIDAGARTEEIDAAEADLRAARSTLRMATAGATPAQIEQLEAGLSAAQSRVSHAEESTSRVEALHAAGAASEAQQTAARTELSIARAEVERISAALSEARSGARPEEVDVLQSRVAQAEARLQALRAGARAPERDAVAAQTRGAAAAVSAAEAGVTLAQAAVDRCSVLAPVGGTVDVVALDVGELAGPGTPIVALGADGPLEVRTWATQAVIGALAVGDEVTVAVEADTVGDVTARVTRISDEPEFTSGNVQTPDDRALLVYRVDLEVQGTPSGLRPGMTGVVDFVPAR
ncbi:MAG: HlyD family efflux transporter periplasmic adaptor subunit [Myxococcales bacterium]|nr:HlyD family efflux transporter periplasmic adaptor subunit [Myxococcales bacterium]